MLDQEHHSLLSRLLSDPLTSTNWFIMTKRDIVVRIGQELEEEDPESLDQRVNQEMVLKIVQKTLDIISDVLAKGDTIELRNFGVFEVKLRKARIGRNPNAPENDVPIPPRAVVKFKPGKEMRERVLNLTPKA